MTAGGPQNRTMSDHDTLVALYEKVCDVDVRLERLDELLAGNGQPGVVTRLAHIEGEHTVAKALGGSTVVSALVALVMRLLGAG